MLSKLQTEIHSILKEIEYRNITRRTECLIQVVNAKADKLCENCPEKPPTFNAHINPSAYLGFIDEFEGVKVRKLEKRVCTLEKGKHWLNGRRAGEYSKTLFVEYLVVLEQYAFQLACWKEQDETKMQMLNLALRLDFLTSMLKAKYQPYSEHACPKPLICTNAFKNAFRARIKNWGLNVKSGVSIQELADIVQKEARYYFECYQQQVLENQISETTSSCNFELNKSTKESTEVASCNISPDNRSQFLYLSSECENLEKENATLLEFIKSLQTELQEVQRFNSQWTQIYLENKFLSDILNLCDENYAFTE